MNFHYRTYVCVYVYVSICLYICVYICIYTHIHIYIFASKSGIEYFINSWDSRVDAWMFDNFYTVFPAAV